MMPATRITAALLLISWMWPASAEAFSRSRDPEDKSVCLYWTTRSMYFYINENCSTDLPVDDCLRAVQAAFSVWDIVPCADFELVYGGTTPRTDIGFDEKNWSNNINLIIWYESNWQDDPTAIALTTNTYDSSSGEIVDADIELNGVNFSFTTPESSYPITDIQNTLVHEAGHVIGLDHSADLSASMYASAKQGETEKRDLSQDDIDGICYVYPLGGKTPACGDGVCKPADGSTGGQSCTRTSDCPAGTICDDQVCRVTCNNDLDCETYEKCFFKEVDRGCSCATGGGRSLALVLLAITAILALRRRKEFP